MPGADRSRGRWFLVGALLWLVAAVLIPALGERVLLGVRGRPVANPAGREAMPGLLGMLSAGSAFVAALLASAGLLRRSGQPGPPAPPPARGPRGPLLTALLVTAAVGALLFQASGRSFEYDEILEMIHEVKTPLRDGLRPRAFINHLSGTLMARAGRALFGESERAARAGATTISILGLGAAALSARRLVPGLLPTVWPTVLLGMHGLMLAYTYQIRGYAPLLWGGLGVGALVALGLSAPGPPGKLRTAGLVGCALLMAFGHFFGFLYLGALTAGLHLYLWTGWRWLGPPLPAPGRPRRRAELSGAAGSLAWVLGASFCFWAHDLPWLLFRSGVAGSSPVPPREVVHGRLLSELPTHGVNSGRADWGALALLLVVGVSFLAGTVRIPALRLVALTAVLPVALVLAASFARPVHLFTRYFAASLPLGVLVASAGAGWVVGRLRRPALPTALVLVVTVVGSWPGFASFLGDDYGYREGVADGVRWLDRNGDARSRFIGGARGELTEVARYYLPAGRTLQLADGAPLAKRQEQGIVDLAVFLGTSRPRWWKRAGFESSTVALPLPATGARQTPLVLLATQRGAVP